MGFFNTLFAILNAMSPYLMLGFLIAGILHSFIPPAIYSRHLSDDGWKATIKAAIFGIPLPLCSCGVLPTAISLYRNGASKAATTSFLIATPQTGVDSIAATYSLLGPAFAVIRPIAALATSFAGGMAVGAGKKEEDSDRCCTSRIEPTGKTSPAAKVVEAFRYGFVDMMQSVGKWLVIGLVIAAVITVAVPDSFFTLLSWSPILSMVIIVIIAIPMYVCATGSIPIALSLMLKGLSPGVAFVLLMAGPAANFASVLLLKRTIGARATMKYVASIVTGAMLFGIVIDYLLPRQWFTPAALEGMCGGACHDGGYSWFSIVCSLIIGALFIYTWIIAPIISKTRNKTTKAMVKKYKVKGMACAHCKATVEKQLSTLPGVTAVTVSLSDGTARVEGTVDDESVARLIESIGYEYSGVVSDKD